MGIYSISGLPSNLTYEISDYKLHDKICDSTGGCSLGITKLITLTIKYKDEGFNSSSTEYNLKIDFDFRKMHTVTYEGITNNNYPTTVIDGGNLTFTATSNIPPKIVAFSNGNRVPYDLYSYENNKFTYNNVTSDVTLKYKEKVYLAYLDNNKYFKESAYKTVIDSIQFVDYVDTSRAVKTYDLSEISGSKDIVGWITSENDLYIGSEWDIYSKNLQNAFNGMSGVQTISFGNFNTSEVTSMYYMFADCSSLSSLDVTSFDTSKVTNMGRMFSNCSNLKVLDVSNFNTSNVTAMHVMFGGMSSLESIDVSNFDTRKVTRMYEMFRRTEKIVELNLANFDTTSVTSMAGMFNSCGVKTLDLSNFNTSNVVDMGNMFNGCSELESLNVSNFDTSKITSMSGMFCGMHKLTELDVSSFDTSNVTTMYWTFEGTNKLLELDLSNFDTSNVTDMTKMFYNSGVKKLYFNNASFDKVTKFDEMFTHINSLISVTAKDSISKSWLENALGEGIGTVTIAS